MSSGRIVQIIGAVIDVEFPRDSLPKIYDALMVTERGLTLEVQQQLGDGVVRAIAMGSSEGVSRGLATKVKESGVQLSMRFLITPHRRRGAEEAIWEDLLRAFAKHNDINLAYPTQRIFYDAQKGSQANPLS